jgi:hypothetical protein
MADGDSVEVAIDETVAWLCSNLQAMRSPTMSPYGRVGMCLDTIANLAGFAKEQLWSAHKACPLPTHEAQRDFWSLMDLCAQTERHTHHEAVDAALGHLLESTGGVYHG